MGKIRRMIEGDTIDLVDRIDVFDARRGVSRVSRVNMVNEVPNPTLSDCRTIRFAFRMRECIMTAITGSRIGRGSMAPHGA